MRAAAAVLVLATWPLAAVFTAAGEKARKPAAPPRITVLDIVAAYKQNDALVDEYLADKTVEVVGVVSSIFRAPASAKGDKAGKGYILELTGVPKLDAEARVQCRFDEKWRKPLAALRPGQQAVVRGTCKGIMPLAEKERSPEAEPSLPPARPSYGVVLVDCELVPPEPATKSSKPIEKKPQ